MKQHSLYIILISAVFATFAVVFDFFPRSSFSPLEKRDLTQFPKFSWQSLASGEFTKAINSWFSDTEPYRDVFLSMSMREKDMLKLSTGDDDITFHAAAEPEQQEPTEEELEQQERQVGKYENKVTAEEVATIANRGIIIVGKGDKTRALMAYGGGAKGGGGEEG